MEKEKIINKMEQERIETVKTMVELIENIFCDDDWDKLIEFFAKIHQEGDSKKNVRKDPAVQAAAKKLYEKNPSTKMLSKLIDLHLDDGLGLTENEKLKLLGF